MLLGRTEPAFNQEDKKRILRWTLDLSMGNVCDASWLATARPEREKRSLSPNSRTASVLVQPATAGRSAVFDNRSLMWKQKGRDHPTPPNARNHAIMRAR
jgi:hypothetical protein